MSDRERPTADNGGGGVNEEGPAEKGDPEEENRNDFGEKSRKGDKGKRVQLFRLRKGKKIPERKRKKRKGISVNSCCFWSGRRGGGGGGGWCCLCAKPPRTAESAGESPTSDPNSPEFTNDMLRTLIEKNDFYSKECNPHLDADD